MLNSRPRDLNSGYWRYSFLLAAALAIGASATAWGASFNIGYRLLKLHDPFSNKDFAVAVWYPTHAASDRIALRPDLSVCSLGPLACRATGAFLIQARRNAVPAPGEFGLIVISHGAGGGAMNHWDTAVALAASGYVVAAPRHPRDESQDLAGATAWIGRPKQISIIIDRLVHDEELGGRVQAQRIGVIGHSLGGYTSLVLAGATPKVTAVRDHCRRNVGDRRFCTYGGGIIQQRVKSGLTIPNVRDARVRALVLLAPVAAFFTDDDLAKVLVPALVIGGERDEITPPKFHAERIAKRVKSASYRSVPNAGHFSFLTSYPLPIRPFVGEAARDPEGFDRDAFHRELNPQIVAFFDRHLPRQ